MKIFFFGKLYIEIYLGRWWNKTKLLTEIQGVQKLNFLSVTYYSCDKKDTDSYNISPIEMRSVWMEIKYVKSGARLLDSNWVNKRGLDLSKEVLWVSVGQREVELPTLKVEGPLWEDIY